MSCVGRAINAGASGRRGSVVRSASRRRNDNCAVHAERSDRSVCGSSRDKSVGGHSRNIAAYCVRRSCTPSRHVSIYFFMYRTHTSGVSKPRFSTSALVVATLSTSTRPVRNARASSLRENLHPPQKADGAEESRELARCAESSEQLAQ